MNLIKKITFLALVVTTFTSCEDEVGPLTDIRPAIPVTVTNAFAYRPEPTVTTSLAGGGNIQIILSIPASSGRTIKEVAVATSTTTTTTNTYTAIQSTGTTGFWTGSPFAASGTTFTFNTTIAQYFTLNPATATTGTNPPAVANVELARRIYFKLTLDDNSVIIAQPVRVLVLA